MAKKIPFVSPVGVARYPHITTPDSTGKYADNKFKVQVLIPKKDAEPLVANLKKLAKELGVSKMPFKEDKDDPSMLVFVAKSKFKPLVFDAKRNEVKKVDLRVGAGSKLRVGGVVFPYDTGLSLQMKQVQIIDLVDGANAMFDEMEGSFDANEFDDSDNGGSMFDSSVPNELDI